MRRGLLIAIALLACGGEAGKPTGAWLPGPRLSTDETIRFPRPPFPQEVSGSTQPPERVEGAVDARSRRTALVAFAAFYLGLSAGYVGEGGTTWFP